MLSNNNNNFNPFKSNSDEISSQQKIKTNFDNFENLNHSTNSELAQYQNEISKYERKITHQKGSYKYRGSAKYHFEFLGSSPEKNCITEKKRNSNIDLNNLSIIRRKIESNSLYVGFENEYGQNTCYLNVVLHFLYFFPCINEYLIKLYLNNKDNIIFSNENIANINNLELFLFLLGKTLFEYQNSLSNSDNKGIIILHTTELRQYLDIISNKIYQFNKVADPVELLSFLLNIINNNNQNEVHKYFFINLVEELHCERCQNKISKKYDKDNFIYHIYVDEVMNFIHQNNIDFYNYNNNLFKLAQTISLNYFKNCEKCNNKIKTILNCNGPDYPIFLLINCIWNNPKPSLKDIIQFFYVLPIEDYLENLFGNNNTRYNNQRIIYNLLGMILFSPALSHYVNIMFNIHKNIFVLYNDDKVKEFNSIHEVYKEITVEQIKSHNPNVYFYPVLLIYYNEIIYDDSYTIKNNIYTYDKYNFLIEECKKAIKEKEIILTDEQKKQNYIELIKAQIQFEKENSIYFNSKKDNNNLGYSSTYKVNEEKDCEKVSKSTFLRMDIDEEKKEKNIKIINNINNYFNNSNINSLNNINKNDNNINNTETLNNNYNNIIKKNISQPINKNNMNSEKIFDTDIGNLCGEAYDNNNIYNINNNGLFNDFTNDNDIKVKRKSRKTTIDPQSYRYRTDRSFFNNIL